MKKGSSEPQHDRISVTIFLLKRLQSVETCQEFNLSACAYANNIKSIFPLNIFTKAYAIFLELFTCTEAIEET